MQLTDQRQRAIWIAAAVVVIAIAAAWSNSLPMAFVFDDIPTITENSSIRPPLSLDDLVFQTRGGRTSDGRPLVAFSLAANFSISALDPTSYRLFNIAVHMINSVLVLLCLRLILQSPRLPESLRAHALPAAFISTLLWAVHPIQTSVVTYIVQRAESMAAFCYLLTIYGFLRATNSSMPSRWQALAVVACFAGVLCKESIATAPVMVYLFDAILFSPSFVAAWQMRRKLYIGLFASWIPLAFIILALGGREGTVGYSEVNSVSYLLTQSDIVTHYLMMCFGLRPVVLDFGNEVLPITPGLLAAAAIYVIAVIIVMCLLSMRQPVGLLGAWFFGILAPTSSFIPVITQVGGSHRMYLPSLAVAVIVAILLNYLASKLQRNPSHRQSMPQLIACCAIAVLFIAQTRARNEDLASALIFWQSIIRDYPRNTRAHTAYIGALIEAQQGDKAIRFVEQMIVQNPQQVRAHHLHATCYMLLAEFDQAIVSFEHAMRLDPLNAEFINGRGFCRMRVGQLQAALADFNQAIAMDPTKAGYWNNRGTCFRLLGQNREALADIQHAIEICPWDYDAHFNLGSIYVDLENYPAALASFEKTLYYHPGYSSAQYWVDEMRKEIAKSQNK